MSARCPALGILMAVIVILWTAIGAQAHGGLGAGSVSVRGSFLLSPMGTANDTFHVFLSDLGLPIGAGDTLRFAWQANNGSGPGADVYFEIHAHPATAGYVSYYSKTAWYDSGSWGIPGPGAFMVYWENQNPVEVTVSYTFDLFPPLDLTFLLVGVAIGVPIIALHWWFSREKRDGFRR